MHPRYLHQRDEDAQKSIEASAATLAKRLGFEPETLTPLTATDRDPAVQTMLRREGIASLLSAVVTKGNLFDETTVPLLPGNVVFIGPSAPVPFSEGPRWLASGDFKCFLEPGGDEHPSLVREVLVGPFRAFDNDSDHELPEGSFLDEAGWAEWVENPQRVAFQLAQQVGFDPYQPQPDESKPRGETWLAERSDWETEVAGLKEHIASLEGKLAAPAPAPAPSALPVSSALPENALELIKTAGGLSTPKAEAVLAALTSKAAPESAETPESSGAAPE